MKNRKNYTKNKIRSLKPKTTILKTRMFWIWILAIVIIAVAIYILIFFSKFQIAHIQISGNQKITSSQIENTVWSSVTKKWVMGISTKSIFLANTGALAQNILQLFPQVDEVSVVRNFTNELTVTIKEREPVAVFCQTGSCFLIDEKGIAFEAVEDGAQYIIITKDMPNNDIALGKQVLDASSVTDIVKIQKNLKDNFNINIKEALVANPLIITTSENWKIYFDPAQDVNLQITKMNLLLKDKITVEDRKNLHYIYLQYKDRAYYK